MGRTFLGSCSTDRDHRISQTYSQLSSKISWWYSSRSTKGRCNYFSGNVIQSFWGNLVKRKIPAEWKEGYLIKIPKRGDLSLCDNFRGITLLSVPGKVLNRIILERMKGEVDKTLREEQAGFRQDRSCTDHIATLRIIVEQSIECHCRSTLLTTRKPLTVWTGRQFGKYYDIMGCPWNGSTWSKTHMRECHAESSMTVTNKELWD